MLIYLAHPIDQAKTTSVHVPLHNVIACLTRAGFEQGHTFYRPARAFQLPQPPWEHEDMVRLDRINRFALFEANGLIAVLLPGIPTLGTPSEVEEALTLNRPTCIVTTNKLRQTSVQLASWASRGASVVLASDDGRIHNPNLADSLCSLPDPSRLFLDSQQSTEPPLLVTRHSTQAKVPSRAYRGDAGLDLAVVGEHEIHPGEYKLLPTGIKAAVPGGYWGLITGRSSTWTEHRFDIRQAVIDSGYRGELMVGVHNRGSERKTIQPGTRLAQYVLMPAFMGDVNEVDELPTHERGENGYGSSGK